MNIEELQDALNYFGPKDVIAEAMASIDDNSKHSCKLYEAATQYARLLPLLNELCGARGRATGGEWEKDEERDHIMSVTPKRRKFKEWVITAWCDEAIIDDENIHFITTAANLTTKISEIIDEK